MLCDGLSGQGLSVLLYGEYLVQFQIQGTTDAFRGFAFDGSIYSVYVYSDFVRETGSGEGFILENFGKVYLCGSLCLTASCSGFAQFGVEIVQMIRAEVFQFDMADCRTNALCQVPVALDCLVLRSP